MALHRYECTMYRQAFKISRSSTLDTPAVRLVLTLPLPLSKWKSSGMSRVGLCSWIEVMASPSSLSLSDVAGAFACNCFFAFDHFVSNQRTTSAVAAFIPVHDQPVTLAALKELEPEILTAGESPLVEED